MKNTINFLKQKISLLAAMIIASIVGGATTGVVMAAIPHTDGLIYACRTNLTGAIRIIDTTSDTCNGLETQLTWNATDTAKAAYAKFAEQNVMLTSASLDTSFTTGITSSQMSSDEGGWCFDVAFTPKIGFVNGLTLMMHLRGITEASDDLIDEYCGAGYDVFASGFDSTASQPVFFFNG